MNYLISVIETIRVPNVNEVEKLHASLKEDNRFDLKKFEYSHKQIKSKGEIIEEYELVKATLVFNIEKEPDRTVKIDFDIEEGYFPEPIVKEENEDEEGVMF